MKIVIHDKIHVLLSKVADKTSDQFADILSGLTYMYLNQTSCQKVSKF